MKKTLKFLSWVFILLFMVSLSSCKDDDEEVTVELSDEVSGVYVGELQSGGITIIDTYHIVISRGSSSTVQFVANFLDEPAVFDVEQIGSQYVLRNTSNYAYLLCNR